MSYFNTLFIKRKAELLLGEKLELFSNNIVRVVFIEEFLASLEQENLVDADTNYGVPAPFAAPPMTPEIKIGSMNVQIVSLLGI